MEWLKELLRNVYLVSYVISQSDLRAYDSNPTGLCLHLFIFQRGNWGSKKVNALCMLFRIHAKYGISKYFTLMQFPIWNAFACSSPRTWLPVLPHIRRLWKQCCGLLLEKCIHAGNPRMGEWVLSMCGIYELDPRLLLNFGESSFPL